MAGKTLLYINGWAFESPYTTKEIKAKFDKNEEIEITVSVNKMNQETGRQDKYLCNMFIKEYNVLAMIDLDWKPVNVNEIKETPKTKKEIKKSTKQ